MKKLIPFLIIITFSFVEKTFSQSVDERPFYSLSWLREEFIKTVFLDRCEEYASKENSDSCEEVTRDYFTTFDLYYRLKEKSVSVFFRQAFLEVIVDESVKEFVKQVKKRFEEVKRFPSRSNTFNLWEYSFNFFDNNHKRTLKVIATLFQDTETLDNIHWLKREEHINEAYYELLKETLTKFSYRNLMRNEAYQDGIISLFPDFVEAHNPSLHHFYTPAYLALELSQKVDLDKKSVIHGLSFYTTVFYKTLKYYKNAIGVYFSDLKRLKVDDETGKFRARDFYLAYSGSFWGVREMCYDDFEKEISTDLIGFLKKSFRDEGTP